MQVGFLNERLLGLYYTIPSLLSLLGWANIAAARLKV
jgi:hypothetical protein